MSMERLTELARLQVAAESDVAQAEEWLKMAKEALRVINENALPELMDQMGMETFTTKDGIKVDVKETIRASIPKAKAPEAMGWLRANGHNHMIKRQISVIANSDKQGEEIVQLVKGYEFTDNATVHPMTLGAFVREQMEAGADLPLDLLGVFRQRVSKVQVS